MPAYLARLRVPVSAADLFAWHERPGAFERLSPPWQPARLERWDGIRNGDRAVIRLGVGPASTRWTAEHRAYSDACRTTDAPCEFTDLQVSGPFAAWRHTHRMLPDEPGASVLEDDVAYRLPLAPLSTALGGPWAEAQIRRLFAYRHRVTRADLGRHAADGGPPLAVAVTGSSGLVGRALCAFLTGGGHTVVRLVRSRGAARALDRGPLERAVYWNVERGEIDLDALAEAAPDAAVHLAGEPVFALRYPTAKKRRIWESRTKGTQLLARALATLDRPPRVLVSASASGFYGDRGAEPLTEESVPGDGFLADVCRAWEGSTAEAEAAGVRTVHARIGIVVSADGGVLPTLLPAAHAGLAGWVGDGGAYWPWVALDDLVYALGHLLRADGTRGPVNVSAPEPATQRAFVRALGAVLGRPAFVSVPEPLARAVAGETLEEVALQSARMLPARLLDAGFSFSYPDLGGALGHTLGRAPAPPP